jgi:hypothetical protein
VSPPDHTVHAPHALVIPESLVPDRRGVLGFLSHVRRDGDWILPRLFRAVALMGNVEIDLTRVHVGAGTSQIEVKAIMGAVTIVVPPWLRVECDGSSIVGGFDVQRKVPSTSSPDAPQIRIGGTAFMGGVDVKVADPGARGWFDRLTG